MQAFCWRAAHFPPAENINIPIFHQLLLVKYPNLLHLSCSLLYELGVLSEQNIHLRESEGRAKGRTRIRELQNAKKQLKA